MDPSSTMRAVLRSAKHLLLDKRRQLENIILEYSPGEQGGAHVGSSGCFCFCCSCCSCCTCSCCFCCVTLLPCCLQRTAASYLDAPSHRPINLPGVAERAHNFTWCATFSRHAWPALCACCAPEAASLLQSVAVCCTPLEGTRATNHAGLRSIRHRCTA